VYIHCRLHRTDGTIRHPDTRAHRLSRSALFYADGIRGVSVDAVAAKAGVTKRTLYYHFRSKDTSWQAYLAGRDQPIWRLFKQWFDDADGALPAKVERLSSRISPIGPASQVEGLADSCGPQLNSPTCRPSRDQDRRPRHKKKFRGLAAVTFELPRNRESVAARAPRSCCC